MNKLEQELERAETALKRAQTALDRHVSNEIPGTMVTGRSGVPARRIRQLERQTDRFFELNRAVAAAKERRDLAAGRLASFNAGKTDINGRRIVSESEKEARCRVDQSERERRKGMTAEEALFVGCYPAGLLYCDRSRERGGDYLKCAFLSFSTLELKIYDECSKRLRPLIEAHAERMQAKRGEQYQTSASGQYVILGKE